MKTYKVTYKKYNRPIFVFNCGSAQDARALFIGNTFFSKDNGTWFNKSEFVKAIETPNAIIVLDELSRLSHDGMNLLIPVLDFTQRTLRLDESETSAVVHVAQGVTFIATANVGNEFTATRVMDLALTNRFPVVVEMEPLGFDEMASLIGVKFPNADQNQLESMLVLCHISDDTKIQVKLDNAKITKFIPTGTIVEAAELVMDGFSLSDIAEMVVYPTYENAGGVDSERLFAKQIVQKYTDKKSAGAGSPINSPTSTKPKTVIKF